MVTRKDDRGCLHRGSGPANVPQRPPRATQRPLTTRTVRCLLQLGAGERTDRADRRPARAETKPGQMPMDNEEVEVTRLPRDTGRTRGSRSRSLAGSPPLPQRVRRPLLLACTLILAILAILALASSLRSGGGFAVFLFPTATPRPTNT